MSLYSSSGFDLVSILIKVATRPHPIVDVGPIDLSCSFTICDARYKAEEILGRNCRFLQDPSGFLERGAERKFTDRAVVQSMQKSVAIGIESQHTLINYKKGGTPFINHITMIPVCVDMGSTPTHFVGLQIDFVQQPQSILKRMQVPLIQIPRHVHISSDSSNMDGATFKVRPSLVSSADFADLISEKTGTSTPFSKLLSSFVNVLPDLLHIVSIRGIFISVAPEATKRILGYEKVDMLGHNLSEFVHPADIVAVMRELRTCTASKNIDVVCRLRHKKAGYVYMLLTGHIYTGQKRKNCYVISGREQYFPTLNLSSAVLGKLTSREAWIKVSLHCLILYASQDAEQIFVLPPEQLVGRSLLDFVHPSDHTHVLKSMQTALYNIRKQQQQKPPDSALSLTPPTVQTDPFGTVSLSFLNDTGQAIQPHRQTTVHPSVAIRTHFFHITRCVPTLLRFFAFDVPFCSYMYCQIILEPSNDTPSDSLGALDTHDTPALSGSAKCENVLEVMDQVRVTTLPFELNRLRTTNKRLIEEIAAVEAKRVLLDT
eukprot:jgi/Hompol1/4587/HPOL_003732-RA